jgi:hypothetical protein
LRQDERRNDGIGYATWSTGPHRAVVGHMLLIVGKVKESSEKCLAAVR